MIAGLQFIPSGVNVRDFDYKCAQRGVGGETLLMSALNRAPVLPYRLLRLQYMRSISIQMAALISRNQRIAA